MSLFMNNSVAVEEEEEMDANLLTMLRAFHGEQPYRVGGQRASAETMQG